MFNINYKVRLGLNIFFSLIIVCFFAYAFTGGVYKTGPIPGTNIKITYPAFAKDILEPVQVPSEKAHEKIVNFSKADNYGGVFASISYFTNFKIVYIQFIFLTLLALGFFFFDEIMWFTMILYFSILFLMPSVNYIPDNLHEITGSGIFYIFGSIM